MKDVTREFYSVINEIRDLYENKGYRKQKSLYLKMKDKHNWLMCYQSFSNYFNKEIKKNSPQNSMSSTPVEVENTPKQNTKMEVKNESDARPTMTPEREAELRRRLEEDISAVGLERSEALKKQLEEKGGG
jgi:hypothetical protein